MRLWSLHPKHLDAAGLVALWREALLAKAVLRGKTKGYRHHPQLLRFQERRDPVAAINSYLAAVHAEAVRRGYRFDVRKLVGPRTRGRIGVSRGQLAHEWKHLLAKLKLRSPAAFATARKLRGPSVHPSFTPRAGPIAEWERP